MWNRGRKTDVREGRWKVTKTIFNLHVVRSAESRATYEDTIDHLSKSEREVTSLIFALAGYLIYDVHKKVPFILLDSFEVIDFNRIATLIDYFKTFVTVMLLRIV